MRKEADSASSPLNITLHNHFETIDLLFHGRFVCLNLSMKGFCLRVNKFELMVMHP